MKGIVKIEQAMKKHGGWLSQLRIHELTGVNKNSIKRSIRTMLQREQIEAKRSGNSNRTGAMYRYLKDYTRKKAPIRQDTDPQTYLRVARWRARNMGAIESMRWL